MSDSPATIAVLGASGLIGAAVAAGLAREGFAIVPIARRFTSAQRNALGPVVERPFVSPDGKTLAEILMANKVDVVVNCVGVLQDGPRGNTEVVHCALVERLLQLLQSPAPLRLLIHISIPGSAQDDPTCFSRTKRAAERTIAGGEIPFIIVRPGFVTAPSAYGSSALIRALAVLPFSLPAREATRAFAVTDVHDIVLTIAFAARRWGAGERNWHEVWEVMARQQTSLAEVVETFRDRLGGPACRLPLPSWLLECSARAGDMISHLGWSPPIRSTALAEIRRGVAGDPLPWIAATGIEPASLRDAVARLSADVQEQWFARLYLAKPLILGTLVSFWLASGLIALTFAFAPATEILISRGFPSSLAVAITIVSSVADVMVGAGIAVNKTCRIALVAGICLSIFYLVGAAVVMPDLWLEPLGSLVKTLPAIVLMLVALAIFENR